MAKNSESSLVKAAKAIGKAAGNVAAVAGVHAEAEPKPASRAKKGKLPKKNKHRLPRRVKKAQQKKAGSRVS